jgi:hypothetical protein
VIPAPGSAIMSNPLTDAASIVSDPTSFSADQPTGGYTGMGPWIVPSVYARRSAIGSITPISNNRVDFQALMDLIQNTISTKSWIDNGGNGTISDVPSHLSLAISQTWEVHRQIEELLADLRSRQRAAPAFQIELRWLWLDAAHRDLLFAGSKGSTARAQKAIDSQRLSQIAGEVPSFNALANCLNGLNAVVASGDRRALIINAVAADKGSGAYQPIVSMPNVGVMAMVAPIMLPGTKTAWLTVESRITRWSPSRPPAVVSAVWGPGKRIDIDAQQPAAILQQPAAPPPGSSGPSSPASAASEPSKAAPASSHVKVLSHGAGSASCPIDLPVMPTQEFGTTLRVPLGKPVLVGSITFAPAGDAGVGAAKTDAVEVYLIATTSVVKKAKKKP